MNESVETVRQRLSADEAVREVINRRAYELYEQSGSQPGHDIEHWLEAEDEIVGYLMAGHAQDPDFLSATLTGAEARREVPPLDDTGEIGYSKTGRTSSAR
jgi:hypothetical protein